MNPYSWEEVRELKGKVGDGLTLYQKTVIAGQIIKAHFEGEPVPWKDLDRDMTMYVMDGIWHEKKLRESGLNLR